MKKILLMIFTVIFFQIAISSANAAITSFVAKDAANVHYEYGYSALQSNYVRYQMGLSAPLYSDFISGKSTVVLKDSVRGYVSYSNVQSAYVRSQMFGTSFDANTYTETTATLYTMPLYVTQTSLVSGSLNQNVQYLGPTITNTSVEGIAPVVTGTTEAPILTFTVVPTATYTAGTATLSENVSYVIHNAFYDITGTATTTENLMNTALALIGLHGGDNFNGTSVRGSTLISNSPLTITLTGASGATVYTISFVAAP